MNRIAALIARHVPLILVVLLLALVAVLAAQVRAADARQNAERVTVVSDQKSGALRVVIDGSTVMTVDAQGVRVTGDLTYSGMFRDTGEADAP